MIDSDRRCGAAMMNLRTRLINAGILGVILSMSFCLSASAYGPKTPQSTGFDIKSKAAVLVDTMSNQVLYEKNPDMRFEPASLTKIVTLYLAFDALKAGKVKPDQQVPISKLAWKMGGSQMYLKVGDQAPFFELLKGIATVSANDAAMAVAEFLAGSQEAFAQLMNQKVESLGLKDTHFVNPHGLFVEGQYTTPHDMALIGIHYMADHPEAMPIHHLDSFEYNGIRQRNVNKLLRFDPDVDGLKTGYIHQSGFHIVATAVREGRRILAVVMGAEREPIRRKDTTQLLAYGFGKFSTVQKIKPGDVVEKIPVVNGKLPTVDLVAEKPLFVTFPVGTEPAANLERQVPPSVKAPIKKGQVLGKLSIDGRITGTEFIHLLAAVDVPLPSHALAYILGSVVGLVAIGGGLFKLRGAGIKNGQPGWRGILRRRQTRS